MALVKKKNQPVLKKDGAPAVRPRIAAPAPLPAPAPSAKDKSRYVYWAFLVFFLLLAGLLAENYLYMSGKRRHHEERAAAGRRTAQALSDDQRRMNESAAAEAFAVNLMARAIAARGPEQVQLLELAKQQYAVSLNHLRHTRYSSRRQKIERNIVKLSQHIVALRKELDDEAIPATSGNARADKTAADGQ